MATFFGEVILPSSRVFFDDNEDSDIEEEIASTLERKKLELKIIDESSLKCEYETLIIVEGTVSRGFADLYLLNEKTKPLAEIYLPKMADKDNLVEIIPQKEENSVLYQLNSKVLLFKASPSVNLTLSGQLMLHVMPWLERCKNIAIFCSKAVWEYRCDNVDSLPPSFERVLFTSSFKDIPVKYQRLDQPNFITGFSASVTSWCQCKGIPCILHVVYTDKEIIDSVTVAPLLDRFKSSKLGNLIVNQCLDSSKLGITCDHSYMYM